MLFRGGLLDCADCDLEFERDVAEDVGEGDWLVFMATDALVGAGVDIMSEGDCVVSTAVGPAEPDDSILIASIVMSRVNFSFGSGYNWPRGYINECVIG